jgi:hypothetical protein
MTADTKSSALPRKRPPELSVADWQLLIAVTFAQVMAVVALRAMPLSRVRVRAARLRRLAQLVVHGSEERTVWAIEASSRRLGRMSTCLVRALVAELLLDSAARPVCLTIGVKLTATGTLAAHAWVVQGNRVLIGATSDDYVPLVGWDSLSA